MPRPIHFELPADDPERLGRFYGEAFGWTVQKWDGPMDYWFLMTGEGEPGIDGAFAKRSEGERGTVNTIGVEDLDGTLAKVKAAGGSVVREKSAIPGVGWMAYCQDTEGNAFGLMQFDQTVGQ